MCHCWCWPKSVFFTMISIIPYMSPPLSLVLICPIAMVLCNMWLHAFPSMTLDCHCLLSNWCSPASRRCAFGSELHSELLGIPSMALWVTHFFSYLRALALILLHSRQCQHWWLMPASHMVMAVYAFLLSHWQSSSFLLFFMQMTLISSSVLPFHGKPTHNSLASHGDHWMNGGTSSCPLEDHWSKLSAMLVWTPTISGTARRFLRRSSIFPKSQWPFLKVQFWHDNCSYWT